MWNNWPTRELVYVYLTLANTHKLRLSSLEKANIPFPFQIPQSFKISIPQPILTTKYITFYCDQTSTNLQLSVNPKHPLIENSMYTLSIQNSIAKSLHIYDRTLVSIYITKTFNIFLIYTIYIILQDTRTCLYINYSR